MEPTKILGVISTVVAIIASIYAIYKDVKSQKDKKEIKILQSKLNRYNWDSVEAGIDSLFRKIFECEYPDVIFAVSGPGAIVAYLYLNHTTQFIPIVLAPYHKADRAPFKPYLFNNSYSSGKFTIYVPEELLNYSDKKILIIDDSVLTGGLVKNTVAKLTSMGFQAPNIKVACLTVSNLAITNKTQVDYFWKIEEDPNHFPWGHYSGKGY